MNASTTVAPVVRTITVNADPQRAFTVFTESFGAWWPTGHHINPNGYTSAYIEPMEGGRWFERAPDGSECDWGTVLAWQPPDRLLLSWHLNSEWAYDPDPAHATEVEVRFIADGGRTRVELEHRGFERAVLGERVRAGVSSPGGWSGLVQRFADLVDGRELTPVAGGEE